MVLESVWSDPGRSTSPPPKSEPIPTAAAIAMANPAKLAAARMTSRESREAVLLVKAETVMAMSLPTAVLNSHGPSGPFLGASFGLCHDSMLFRANPALRALPLLTVNFLQDPPIRANRFKTDRVHRHAWERLLPEEIRTSVLAHMEGVGELAASLWPELAELAESNPPTLTTYDAWGGRVDRIDVDPAWTALVDEGRKAGVVSLPYDASLGRHGRVLQFSVLDLFMPVSATADCPLSMTDAAARVLLNEDPELADKFVPGLTTSGKGLTSGQWMTEREGGSDVGRTSTSASKHGDGTWTLRGSKWFTSATTADIALALARPEGAGEGSRALTLFLLELRRPDGSWNGIQVRRLKDKLGTKALPTAELDLDGTLATPVGDIGSGVRRIAAMLNVTRVHAAFGGVAALGEGLSLARDYASRRQAFGRSLRDLPLHRRWMAELNARYEGISALAYRAAELLGGVEHGEADPVLARVVIPLSKLACARVGTDVASQIIESFGGAGYVEDTGIPRILRDVHVNCIWEGTTSVMALDVMRALMASGAADAILRDTERLIQPHRGDAALAEAATSVADALVQIRKEFENAEESDARRIAWALADTYSLALVIDAAAWAIANHDDPRASYSAKLLATRPLVAPRPSTSSDQEAELAFASLENED